MSLTDKINKAMVIYGLVLPAPVREILKDIAAELVTLRAEVDTLKGEHGKTD